ncbi:hypothetical protein [Dongia sp.]|uniref:hypothetical protein n=1 Tax=Dongia sp. TaxID=1977262 RepID=UPI0035AE05F6
MTGKSKSTADCLADCEPWIVLAVGVFITCCRTGNFSPLDVARQPAVLKGQMNQGIAKIGAPSWFPVVDSILQTEDGGAYCRVGDLAAPRSIVPADANVQHVTLDLRAMTAASCSFSLVYFPWFRFLAEPVNFDAAGRVASFIADCFLFLLKKQGFSAVLAQDGDSCRIAFGELGITLVGQMLLDQLMLKWGEAETMFDAAGRSIRIDARMFPSAYQAAAQIVSEGDQLDNAIVTITPQCAILRYAPEVGHV